jgi:hypothetical protein
VAFSPFGKVKGTVAERLNSDGKEKKWWGKEDKGWRGQVKRWCKW